MTVITFILLLYSCSGSSSNSSRCIGLSLIGQGCELSTTESLPFDELIGLADAWLLRAKRNGRNQVKRAAPTDNVTMLSLANEV